jgi:hypothetical protein
LKTYSYYIPFIFIAPLLKLISIIKPNFKQNLNYKKFYENGITFKKFREQLDEQMDMKNFLKFAIIAINLDVLFMITLILIFISRGY